MPPFAVTMIAKSFEEPLPNAVILLAAKRLHVFFYFWPGCSITQMKFAASSALPLPL